MERSELIDRTGKVLENIQALSREVGREITLLAATKTRNKEEIQTVISHGVRYVGENKADELCRKFAENAYAGAELHFIGTLQSNKAKMLVGKVSLIHSLCTESAALAIEKAASALSLTQDVLIEIHVGNEETKSGIPLDKAEDFAALLKTLPHIRLRGLMCVPPVGEDPAPYFDMVRQAFDAMKERYSLDTLSMGMSSDFETAIRHGATMVRVGTGIFGARDYSKK